MKSEQISKFDSLIQLHSTLQEGLNKHFTQDSLQMKEISQQKQKLYEIKMMKVLKQYELELENDMNTQQQDESSLGDKYKEKLQYLLNLINTNENEMIQLVSISKSQLIANYFIFKPNKLKNTYLLELELTIDTNEFKIKNVLNKQNNQFITQNELALTLANLTQNYNFDTKSVFFTQNYEKAVYNQQY